ncbi:MAG TPA: hypothetical protein VK536_04625 [Candidatus Limnocylindrales bacterium]|nr:hypothetical protein [Candidatus Limnocylindrales bacterium]
MKTLKSKAMAILIAALLTFSMTASMALTPRVNAQTFSFPTQSFINVAPNPAGVGQTVTVDFWLAVPLEDVQDATNMTIVVTNPAGTSTTLGPFTTDLTGGTTTRYTPTTTGNYTFEMFYGGQILSTTDPEFTYLDGDRELPSHSPVVKLAVQQSPVSGIPFTPLPTTWWQTPVNGENVQNWYTITGPWLGTSAAPFASTGDYNATGNFNPYTTGPTTAHILWTKPWCIGGVAGGPAGGTETSDYWTASQYEPKWTPVVIDGIVYATWYTTDTDYSSGIVATDLYNGQTLFTINTTNALTCGMEINWKSPNQYGVVGPYLITEGPIPGAPNSDYNFYDGLTGAYVCSIVNGPFYFFLPGGFGGGSLTPDANGNLIGYFVNDTTGYVTVHPGETSSGLTSVQQYDSGPTLVAWNMTDALGEANLPAPAVSEWSIGSGEQFQWDEGIMWAMPIPTTLNGQLIGTNNTAIPDDMGYSGLTFGGLSMGQLDSGVIVMYYGDADTALAPSVGETAGWLIEAGFSQATGALLWGPVNRTETPFTRLSENFYQLSGDGIYVDLNEATDVANAYYLQTGALAWTTTLTANGAPPNPYDEYGIQTLVDTQTAVMFFWGLGGDVWAVNMTNGNIIWWTSTTKLTGSPGSETPYGTWPLWVQFGGIAAPGILYLSEGHEYSPPLFHGANLIAINMTDGQLLWKILAFDDTATEVSCGIVTGFNSYDGQVYAYGRGPSKTTVTAPDIGVTTATPVTITGTVMDVSAGAQQQAVAANFPNGLPCVSDASMTQFMEAVYEQQPMPTNVTGVPVTIAVTDSNHNCYDVGTATTDASGTYSLTWTPIIPGNFTVTATFAGTQSYYGSSAEAHFYASSPPPTSAPTASPPTGLASTSSLELGIAVVVIVIIIIGAILAVIMLRKRP